MKQVYPRPSTSTARGQNCRRADRPIGLACHWAPAILAALVLWPAGVWGQGLKEQEIAELRQMEMPTEPWELLAIVGDTPILLGELLPKVDARIASSAKGDLSQVPPEELKIVRLKLLRMLLTQTIQTKMLGYAFLMDRVGSSAAKQRHDAQSQIETQARKVFYEKQVPHLMENLKVDSLQEVDAQLRKQGSSLEGMEGEFLDSMLRSEYVRQLIPEDPKVNLNEIRLYYNAHRSEFETPSKARWEQLTVLFANFPSREAADAAIKEMGTQAYFGGNVQQVARERSQEPLASQGGLHDWTRRGSLASKPLDEQIFTLPLNRLSDVIEDKDGFHIIRVLDRKDAGVIPLSEVQDKIRKILQDQKVSEAEQKLLIKIRKDVPVYTRYPQDIEGSLPLELTAPAPVQRR